MAASTQQKVDYLLKKIGYTASKTGLAEDSSLSGTKKAPFAEAVPSPLVIANSSVWSDSAGIPATPPGSLTDYVQVYLSATSGHHMTVDSTVSGNRAYIAYSSYDDNTSAILGDWIDTQFGASYIIKVYKGDPNSGGVSLSAAGSGSNDGWFFDYSSGILNFNDTNVPSGVTDSNIYIVGYRYIGAKGVIAPGGVSSNSQLNVTGVSTFGGAIDANGGADISGGVGLNVVGHTELDNVNVSGVITAAQFSGGSGGGIVISEELVSTVNLSVSVGATFTGAIDANGSLDVDGQTDLDVLNVAELATFTGNIDANGDLDVDGHTELDNVNVSGVITASSFSGGSGGTIIGEDVATRNLSVSMGSTFTGAIDANGDLDVDGHTELDNVKVTGVSTFNNDVNFYGPAGVSSVTWDKSDNALEFLDHAKASFGTGGDLSIYHNATASYVDNNTGPLYIRNNVDDDDGGNIIIEAKSGKASAVFQDDEGVRLYFDDAQKFETGYSGAIVSGMATATGGFSGDITGAGATFTNVTGTLQTAAQPNVTSLGTIGSLVASTAKVSDLTSGRVVTAGTTGELEDSSNLTFDGTNKLAVTGGLTVSAGATFSALVDGNAGCNFSGAESTFSSATVSDLTDNRIVLAGTSGALEDSSKITFDGTTLAIVGDATFTGNVSVAGTLTSEDKTELDVIGIVTARTGVRITSGGLTVNSGVSTFTDAIDANGGLDVSGGSGLVASSAKISDLTSGRVVVAGTSGELEDASTFTFSGGTVTATNFSGNLTGALQTAAQTNITSVGNLTGLVVNGDLDLYGSAGVSSVTWDKSSDYLKIKDNAQIVFGNTASAAIWRDGTNTFIANYQGHLTLRGGTSSSNIRIQPKSGEQSINAIKEGAVELYFDGSKKIESSYTGAIVTGILTATSFTGTLNTAAQTNITSLGTLTGLTVSGTIDANGDLDVDGLAELDYVNVSAASTFAGFIDANAGADVAGGFVANSAKISDLTSGRVVVAGTDGELEDASTFTFSGGTVSATAFSATNLTGTLQTAAQGNVTSVGTLTGLDVNGHTELDNIQVTGIATVANVVLTKNTTGVGATIGGQNVGVITYYGDGSQLTGIAADATALKDGDDNVKVQAVTTGAVVTGIITATEQFSGQITGVGATFTNITGTLQTAAQTNITSLGTLTVLDVNGDQQFYGSAGVTSAIWDKSENLLRFNDHVTAKFGTGNDLSIYHDSTHSYITNTTGDLKITDTSAMILATNSLRLKNGASDETYLAADNGSDVALYFNNSKKFETTHTGAIVTGILTATTFSGNGDFVDIDVDGLAELDYVNVSAAATIDGNLHLKDNDKLRLGATLGSNTLDIYNSSGAGSIQMQGTGSLTVNAETLNLNSPIGEHYIVCNRDADVEIYYDHAKKLETTYSGVVITGVCTATNFSGNFLGTLSGDTMNGITQVGTVALGTWQGTAIADAYIASAATWNAKQAALTFGIADTNALKVDDSDAADDDYAKFTASGIEGRSYSEVKTDLSLGNVENTALSTWAGSTNITTLGTIATGTWNGTAIGDSYISSAGTWNAKQAALTFGIADTNAVKIDDSDAADNDYCKLTATGIEGRSYSEVKTDLSLSNVENTALSTWGGSSNITTIGSLSSLSVDGDAIFTGDHSNVVWDKSENALRFRANGSDMASLEMGEGVGAAASIRLYTQQVGGGNDNTTSFLNVASTHGQFNVYVAKQGMWIQNQDSQNLVGFGDAGFNNYTAFYQPVSFGSTTVTKAVLKDYTETIKTIGNTGTSATLDLEDGNVFTATLTGNCTFTFSTSTNSYPNAASFTLILANDSTPSRTISWPASVKWPNNSAPSRTTAASKTDIWTFMTPDNGTTWYGNIALYNFT